MTETLPPITNTTFGEHDHKHVIVVTLTGNKDVGDGVSEIEQVTVIPVPHTSRAQSMFMEIVNPMIIGFAEEGVSPVYSRSQPHERDYIKVTFANPNGTCVTVERF